MPTIKEYCKTIDGTISPIMDILSDLEHAIQENTENTTGGETVIDTPGSNGRLEERKLVNRSQLRKDAWLQAQMAASNKAFKYLSDFVISTKDKLNDIANDIPINLQYSQDNIVKSVSNVIDDTTDNIKQIDDTLKAIINQI